jgi:hypothetical protein
LARVISPSAVVKRIPSKTLASAISSSALGRTRPLRAVSAAVAIRGGGAFAAAAGAAATAAPARPGAAAAALASSASRRAAASLARTEKKAIARPATASSRRTRTGVRSAGADAAGTVAAISEGIVGSAPRSRSRGEERRIMSEDRMK